MQSKAKTVTQYLNELPADRKAELSKVRAVIRKNLPKGLAEQMSSGMIGYVVPHKLYPPGYHCDPRQPLPFAGLAAQKNHMSLYMMTVYGDAKLQKWLREQFDARGKRLDMGKSCIRFRKADDLPLDVIGEAIGRVSVADYITICDDAAKASKSRKK
ncbi:MAG: DUF1801 domain-containing protein [Bryobacteraceae bacterium]